MVLNLDALGPHFHPPRDAQRVIGTYLYPLYFFGVQDPADAYSATEVITAVQAGPHEILITRMGGLFVRPPSELSDLHRATDEDEPADDLSAKLAFEDEASNAFNRLICELCLLGVVSQPTSPVHISYALLAHGHVVITGAAGGREFYRERTMGPLADLLGPNWLMWPIRPETVLQKAGSLTRANRLAEISPSMPEFVAGAYSLYSQRQINEALADSWVVCEQLLNYLWQRHCAEMADKPRKKRLDDTRTYSASVRLEVLRTAELLPDSLYQVLHKARDHRNKLLHRAKMDFQATSESMTAMKMMLEDILGEPIEPPETLRGVNW